MGVVRKASLVKPADDPGKAWPAIAIGLFVAFGGVLYGYDTGAISGIIAMSYWGKEFSTGYKDADGNPTASPSQQSAIVSILSAGTFFGSLFAAFLAENIGRKPSLMISTWVFNLGVALQTASTAIPLFLAGRFFAGFGVGLISSLIPLYQSETAPKWIRGGIVGSYQLAITIGILLANIVNNATHKENTSASYRIPIAVQFAYSLVLFVGMFFLPETPRYLIKKGRDEKAARSMGRLRQLPVDHPGVARELAEVKANHEFELSLGPSTYIECFKPPILKRQLTGIALQALQQLTGINFIFYYGTKYFQNSGVSSGFIISMITSAINTASTIPGLYAIDKWGRRPLLLWGAVGMCISQFIVGMCGTFSTGQHSDGSLYVKSPAGEKASVAFTCIYISFFAATWGPLAWVVTGEIYPLKTRGKSVSMSVASNWLLNWAIGYSTPYLVNYGDGYANLQSKIFFVWFGACFICIAFVYFFIYETKGLSLEQVDQLYAEVKVASKSVHWVPTETFVDIQHGGDKAEGLMPEHKTTTHGDVTAHEDV